MTPAEQIADIEKRALAARIRIAEVCRKADIRQQVWSRAKGRKSADPITLGKMSDALDGLIAEREAGKAAA